MIAEVPVRLWYRLELVVLSRGRNWTKMQAEWLDPWVEIWKDAKSECSRQSLPHKRHFQQLLERIHLKNPPLHQYLSSLSLRRQFEPSCHPLLEYLILTVHLARSIERSDAIGAITDYDLLPLVCVVHSLVWVRCADVWRHRRWSWWRRKCSAMAAALHGSQGLGTRNESE